MPNDSVPTGRIKPLVELLPDVEFTSENVALPPDFLSTTDLRRMLDAGTTDERDAVDIREGQGSDDPYRRP